MILYVSKRALIDVPARAALHGLRGKGRPPWPTGRGSGGASARAGARRCVGKRGGGHGSGAGLGGVGDTFLMGTRSGFRRAAVVVPGERRNGVPGLCVLARHDVPPGAAVSDFFHRLMGFSVAPALVAGALLILIRTIRQLPSRRRSGCSVAGDEERVTGRRSAPAREPGGRSLPIVQRGSPGPRIFRQLPWRGATARARSLHPIMVRARHHGSRVGSHGRPRGHRRVPRCGGIGPTGRPWYSGNVQSIHHQ